MRAYLTQLDYFFGKAAEITNFAEPFKRYYAQPFTSSLIDDCIEKGKDLTQWTYHLNDSPIVAGHINIADSLTAMKKLVFEEKIVSMEELIEALKVSWEGKEELRQEFLRAPKFGNDDDYADLIAREVHIKTAQAFAAHKNYYGEPYGQNGGALWRT